MMPAWTAFVSRMGISYFAGHLLALLAGRDGFTSDQGRGFDFDLQLR